MTDTTLANLQALEEDLGSEFLTELLELYFNDTKVLLEQLGQAVKNTDATATARIAHSIKGSSANLRMEQMADVSAAIERTAKAGQVKAAAELLAELERHFKVASQTLELRAR
jgi:HPt (histidine-containing phosphotransfer) domain-containing protein